MKAKFLYLLPAIAMLIACGSNKESSSESSQQSSGSESVSESQQSESSETSQQSSSEEVSSSEEGSSEQSSSEEISSSEESSSEESSSEEVSSSEESSSEQDGYMTVEFVPADFGEAMDSQGNINETVNGLTLDAMSAKLHLEYTSQQIELRIYASGSVKFSAESIKSISFVTQAKDEKGRYSAEGLEADVGTYTAKDTTGTWTGEASSVEFSAPSVQVRIKSFTVTYK